MLAEDQVHVAVCVEVGHVEAVGAPLRDDQMTWPAGGAELHRLRPGSILVNTARGELLEPGAVADRLARGDVRGALDVFDPEPLDPADPLLAVPGTVLTPHLGFRTPGALQRMAEGAVANVEAFLAGSPTHVVA